MKKTLLISLFMVAGVVQASTEDLIKESHLSTGTTANCSVSRTNTFGSSLDNITAANVSAWLQNKAEAVYWTTMDGNQGDAVTPTIRLNAETGTYSFSMTNRKAYKGAVAGIVTSVTSDLNLVTGLTLSLDVTAAGNAGSSSLTLVYQTAENVWASTVTKFTATNNETATVTVNFGDDLSLYSNKIYAVIATTEGAGTTFAGNISLTATTASVPEPATASLSLLALGALALRRRRK